MANVKIGELYLTSSDLLQNSESYLNEVADRDMQFIKGGQLFGGSGGSSGSGGLFGGSGGLFSGSGSERSSRRGRRYPIELEGYLYEED